MVRILVQIGAALRAQSQAIRLAQRLQRQFLDQRVAQKRLNIGPGSAFKQRIRILRLVFAGDNVDFLFLDAALAVFAALYCDWRKTRRKSLIFLEKLPTINCDENNRLSQPLRTL